MWQYLLAEIEELQFHTPLYIQMLTMYREAINQNIEPDDSYMIRYGSPQIVETVVNITTEREKPSENWQLMHEIVIPHESDSDLLPEGVYTHILRLKSEFIDNLLEDLGKQLDTHNENTDKIDELLVEFMRLKEIQKEMDKPLGKSIRN
jgi:DNA primase